MRNFLKILSLFSFFFILTSPIKALSDGDLVINEIMKDPQQVADNQGEWFELYNSSNQTIDLRGIEISDNDSDHFLITGTDPVIVLPFGYFVLGRNDDSGSNGGVVIDYLYFGFNLANTADEIVIWENGVEIDRVEYDNGVDFPDPAGASMALLDPAFDNNIGSSWAVSTTPYGNGDLGTPGEANFPAPTPTPTITLIPNPTATPSLIPTATITPILTPALTPDLSPSPLPPFFLRSFLKRSIGEIWKEIFSFKIFSSHFW